MKTRYATLLLTATIGLQGCATAPEYDVWSYQQEDYGMIKSEYMGASLALETLKLVPWGEWIPGFGEKSGQKMIKHPTGYWYPAETGGEVK